MNDDQDRYSPQYLNSLGVNEAFSGLWGSFREDVEEFNRTFRYNNRRLVKGYTDGAHGGIEIVKKYFVDTSVNVLKGVETFENFLEKFTTNESFKCQPSILCITGPQGVGKTMLLQYVFFYKYREHLHSKMPKLLAIDAAAWDGESNFENFIYSCLYARMQEEDFIDVVARLVGPRKGASTVPRKILDYSPNQFVEHVLAFSQASTHPKKKNHKWGDPRATLCILILDNLDKFVPAKQIKALYALSSILDLVEARAKLYRRAASIGRDPDVNAVRTPFYHLILSLRQWDFETFFPQTWSVNFSSQSKRIRSIKPLLERYGITPASRPTDQSHTDSDHHKGVIQIAMKDGFPINLGKFVEAGKPLSGDSGARKEALKSICDGVHINDDGKEFLNNEPSASETLLDEYLERLKTHWLTGQTSSEESAALTTEDSKEANNTREIRKLTDQLAGFSWKKQFQFARKIIYHPSMFREFILTKYPQCQIAGVGDHEVKGIYFWYAVTDFLQPVAIDHLLSSNSSPDKAEQLKRTVDEEFKKDKRRRARIFTVQEAEEEPRHLLLYRDELLMNPFLVQPRRRYQYRNPLIGLMSLYYVQVFCYGDVLETSSLFTYLCETGYEARAAFAAIQTMEAAEILSPSGAEILPQSSIAWAPVFRQYLVNRTVLKAYCKLVFGDLTGRRGREEDWLSDCRSIFFFQCERAIAYDEAWNKRDLADPTGKALAVSRDPATREMLEAAKYIRYMDKVARLAILQKFFDRLLKANHRLEANMLTHCGNEQRALRLKRPCLVRLICQPLFEWLEGEWTELSKKYDSCRATCKKGKGCTIDREFVTRYRADGKPTPPCNPETRKAEGKCPVENSRTIIDEALAELETQRPNICVIPKLMFGREY